MASALALMAPLASPPVHTSFTLAASGDLLIHQPVWVRARADGGGHYDFRPMLRYVKPIIAKADVALCHIETPMSDRPPAGYPVFNTPSALARAVKWAGWDVCDTASNHSLDQGQAGIDSTGVALRRAGVLHTGSFRSAAAQRRITMLTVRGVKVAFLAYTEMTNGIALPHPWSVNLARAGTIRADARRARAQGAQVVVVNIHWGDEYHSRPSAFQRRLAGAIMRGHLVTALVGQHVHVVQPIARVHGRLVVYGEGNLLSNQNAACCPPRDTGRADRAAADLGRRPDRSGDTRHVCAHLGPAPGLRRTSHQDWPAARFREHHRDPAHVLATHRCPRRPGQWSHT